MSVKVEVVSLKGAYDPLLPGWRWQGLLVLHDEEVMACEPIWNVYMGKTRDELEEIAWRNGFEIEILELTCT